jgi:hypothetical protein
MSAAVRGYVSEFFETAFLNHGIGVARTPMQESDIPVLLVPDDGTQVVVGKRVVYWADTIYANGDHAVAYMKLREAILGTEGGGV